MNIRYPMQLYPPGHLYREFAFVIPVGVSLDAAMTEKYWQHVQAQLKKWDVLEVFAEDNSYEARLRVINPSKQAFALRVLSVIDWTDVEPAGEAPAQDSPPVGPGHTLTVGFAPKQGWRVIEQLTKDVISKGHETKEEALRAMDNILSARKAA